MTDRTNYRYQVQGTAGTSSWFIERQADNDADAIDRAHYLALEFVGMRGFMGLNIFRMTSATEGEHVATVRLEEPKTSVSLPK